MRIDARINARLRASTGLVAYVGEEIRPAALASTNAGVLYDVGNSRPAQVMGGGTGWRQSRCRVTTYQQTFALARATATEVLKSLSRWVDTTGGVSDTLFVTESHDRRGNLWLIEQDYTIHHTT